ncbi:MAG: hypothetical protein AB1650_04185 [Candidatus Omnitrophota bacterium]
MRKGLILLLVVPLLTGCVTTYRSHPSFQQSFNTSETIAIISPHMKMHQLTAGGIPQYMEDWSRKSKEETSLALKDHVEEILQKKTLFIDGKDFTDAQKMVLDQQAGMFYVVATSVLMHTYESPFKFPHKIKKFDYSLGPEVAQLKQFAPEANIFIFCSGQNFIWTAGRVCMSVVGAALGIQLMPGSEWIVVGLVDANSGDLLWFDYVPMPGDLREHKVVDVVIKKLLSRIERRRKKT